MITAKEANKMYSDSVISIDNVLNKINNHIISSANNRINRIIIDLVSEERLEKKNTLDCEFYVACGIDTQDKIEGILIKHGYDVINCSEARSYGGGWLWARLIINWEKI